MPRRLITGWQGVVRLKNGRERTKHFPKSDPLACFKAKQWEAEQRATADDVSNSGRGTFDKVMPFKSNGLPAGIFQPSDEPCFKVHVSPGRFVTIRFAEKRTMDEAERLARAIRADAKMYWPRGLPYDWQWREEHDPDWPTRM